jgi:DNA-binding HxlR family transcriptional regulator
MIKKPETDPPGCTADIAALQDSLDILGGKWKLLILHYLMLREYETNTFKKIEKDIGGISAKVLSNELKVLEGNLMVKREEMNTRPVTVRYSVTDYGKEAGSVITALVGWGMKHRMKIFEDSAADNYLDVRQD